MCKQYEIENYSLNALEHRSFNSLCEHWIRYLAYARMHWYVRCVCVCMCVHIVQQFYKVEYIRIDNFSILYVLYLCIAPSFSLSISLQLSWFWICFFLFEQGFNRISETKSYFYLFLFFQFYFHSIQHCSSMDRVLFSFISTLTSTFFHIFSFVSFFKCI